MPKSSSRTLIDDSKDRNTIAQKFMQDMMNIRSFMISDLLIIGIGRGAYLSEHGTSVPIKRSIIPGTSVSELTLYAVTGKSRAPKTTISDLSLLLNF